MTKPPASSDRDQRLAAKLKENLRRRKAQSRARADENLPKTRDGALSDAAIDPKTMKP